ncbi:MAG: alanine racemase [Bacteroidales bacterium]|nr:alanine racemase [Bacteroidales bacterium]MCF8404614.1 alanine racemase [Bacteroidales bacterium]
MQSATIIELSQSAIEYNLKFIQVQMGDKIIISSVVKGNAYGHGIEEIVPIIEECGGNHFSVFSADEAYRVFHATRGKNTILILGFIPDNGFEWVIKNDIEFYISNLYRARKVLEEAKKTGKKAIVHLDIETGMNRTGLNDKDLMEVVSLIQNNTDQFYVRGVCTHFAGAESISNFVRLKNQDQRFREIVSLLKGKGIVPDILHAACSASAMVYPETRYDMVRIGIMQYGFWPSKETFIHYIHNKTDKSDPLRRALRWKSKVMEVKSVCQGEFIGYGNYYQAYNNIKIAIIPVGYYNGYSRSLSNQGKVLINNQRVSIIGMVNMNMIIANISKLPNVKPGDEVVMIGKQGKYQLSVASFSELSNQVNYELLTRLPQDINRIKTK